MTDSKAPREEIKVYAFGELPPGTELVLKSAFDALAKQVEELSARRYELLGSANKWAARAAEAERERDRLREALEKIEKYKPEQEWPTDDDLENVKRAARQALTTSCTEGVAGETGGKG